MKWKITAILITAFYVGMHIMEGLIDNSPRVVLDRELGKWVKTNNMNIVGQSIIYISTSVYITHSSSRTFYLELIGYKEKWIKSH